MPRCTRLHADELLGSREAAARAGLSYDTWRSYVSRGKAPAPVTWIGSAPAWTGEQIDRWREARGGR